MGRPETLGRQPTAGARVLRGYHAGWIPGDVAAGLTVGALLVTQCMAYAPLAGLPPASAFRAVIVALPVYALLGTSRHLVTGPDPGTAAIAGAGLAGVAIVGSAEYADAAAALALMVGILLVAAGRLRLGFVSAVLSRPALIGYLTGLGVTLVVGQMSGLTGIPVDADSFAGRVRQLVERIDQVHGPTALLGAGTLAVILLLRARVPRVPGAVAAVVLATLVTVAVDLEDRGVRRVGELDAGLPRPGWPDLPIADWGELVATALAVAVLGFADSYLTASGVATERRYRLDPDRELTGLGAANVAAGAVGGMPVASTGSGTATASAAGGNTQLTLILAAGFVALSVVALGEVIVMIPVAALAAVVVSAGIALVHVSGFALLWRESRAELALAVTTLLAVCAFDVLVGILVSIGLGVLIALARMARPHVAVLGNAAHLDGWVAADAHEGVTIEPGLLVYRFDAPLFFLNALHFGERLMGLLDDNPGDERWVLLDFEGVGSVDTTGTEALSELLRDLDDRGVVVVGVVRANDVARDRLRRAGLLRPQGPLHDYATIAGAVRAFRAWRDDR